MKILIVDDNPTNLYMLESLLKGGHHECVTAINGDDAWDKLRANDVELIVSDTLMPIMDGFQFCHAVKRDARFSHIPFVFYSGTYREKEDIELATKLGAARYLVKPMDPSELLREIQQVIKEVGEGQHGTPQGHLPEEKEIYRLYSERLVNKLEGKMSDLQKEVVDRKQIEADLVDTLHSLKKVIGEKNQSMVAFAQESGDSQAAIKTAVGAIRKNNTDPSLNGYLDAIEKELTRGEQIISKFMKDLPKPTS